MQAALIAYINLWDAGWYRTALSFLAFGGTKMRKEFRTKLKGDDSRADTSAYFTLPFDTRNV